MDTTIQPVVAGTFYPANPQTLQTMLRDFFDAAQQYATLPIPKAIIAPHAGYVYSGPIAASAYACLQQVATQIKQVVLLAPSHRTYFAGVATSTADFYATPLGEIPLAKNIIKQLTANFRQVSYNKTAFAAEHALEVHLPFLQFVLRDFQLIPLIVCDASIVEVAEIITSLWDDTETLIVVSSDLSHYNDYATAKLLDSQTAMAITTYNLRQITSEHACGHLPIQALLTVAQQKKLTAAAIDLRNSGDTAGDKSSVVGYGAFHFYAR